jgi:hypothetical protein
MRVSFVIPDTLDIEGVLAAQPSAFFEHTGHSVTKSLRTAGKRLKQPGTTDM